MTLVNNELDSKLKFEEIKSKYDQQLSTIREDIRSKVKENKRLYHAFKSIRDSNESLRLKVIETRKKIKYSYRIKICFYYFLVEPNPRKDVTNGEAEFLSQWPPVQFTKENRERE